MSTTIPRQTMEHNQPIRHTIWPKSPLLTKIQRTKLICKRLIRQLKQGATDELSKANLKSHRHVDELQPFIDAMDKLSTDHLQISRHHNPTELTVRLLHMIMQRLSKLHKPSVHRHNSAAKTVGKFLTILGSHVKKTFPGQSRTQRKIRGVSKRVSYLLSRCFNGHSRRASNCAPSSPVSMCASSSPASQCTSTPASHCTSTPASHCTSTPASHCTSTPASHCTSTPASQCTSTPASQCALSTAGTQGTPPSPISPWSSLSRTSLSEIAGSPTLYKSPGLTGKDSKYAVAGFVPRVTGPDLGLLRRIDENLQPSVETGKKVSESSLNNSKTDDGDAMDISDGSSAEAEEDDEMKDVPTQPKSATNSPVNFFFTNPTSAPASVPAPQPVVGSMAPDHQMNDPLVAGLPKVRSVPIPSAFSEYRRSPLINFSFWKKMEAATSLVAGLSDEDIEPAWKPFNFTGSDRKPGYFLSRRLAGLSLNDKAASRSSSKRKAVDDPEPDSSRKRKFIGLAASKNSHSGFKRKKYVEPESISNAKRFCHGVSTNHRTPQHGLKRKRQNGQDSGTTTAKRSCFKMTPAEMKLYISAAHANALDRDADPYLAGNSLTFPRFENWRPLPARSYRCGRRPYPAPRSNSSASSSQSASSSCRTIAFPAFTGCKLKSPSLLGRKKLVAKSRIPDSILNSNKNSDAKLGDIFKFSAEPIPCALEIQEVDGAPANSTGQPPRSAPFEDRTLPHISRPPASQPSRLIAAPITPPKTASEASSSSPSSKDSAAVTNDSQTSRRRIKKGFRERPASSRQKLELLLPSVSTQHKLNVQKVIDSPLCDTVPAVCNQKVTSIPDLATVGPGASVTPLPFNRNALSKDQEEREPEEYWSIIEKNPKVWLGLITATFQSGRTPKDLLGKECDTILGGEWVVDHLRLDRIARRMDSPNFSTREDIPITAEHLFDQTIKKIGSGNCQVFGMAIKEWVGQDNSRGSRALLIGCLRNAGWVEAQSEYASFMRWAMEFAPAPIRSACIAHFKWAYPRLLHAVSSERLDHEIVVVQD